MTNFTVIENRISSVKKYLRTLEDYKKYSRKEIEDSTVVRGAVERYLYLAAQATIDLAEAFISFKGLRKPSTMTENFYILNEEKIIPQDLTRKLVGMVGFRNILAHDYGEVNYDIVYDILQNKLINIKEFLKIIAEQ